MYDDDRLMDIIGLGIDATEIARVAATIERYGDRFLAKRVHRRRDRLLPAQARCGLVVRGALRGEGSRDEGARHGLLAWSVLARHRGRAPRRARRSSGSTAARRRGSPPWAPPAPSLTLTHSRELAIAHVLLSATSNCAFTLRIAAPRRRLARVSRTASSQSLAATRRDASPRPSFASSAGARLRSTWTRASARQDGGRRGRQNHTERQEQPARKACRRRAAFHRGSPRRAEADRLHRVGAPHGQRPQRDVSRRASTRSTASGAASRCCGRCRRHGAGPVARADPAGVRRVRGEGRGRRPRA